MVICAVIASTRIPYQMLAEGAGKFRETRNGAILEVIVNIGVSVLAVLKLGFIGVLIGTLCAGVVRTLEYAIFSIRKILKSSVIHIARHYLTLIITFILCYAVGKVICLDCTTYLYWILSASLVFLSSALIVVIISLIFYKKQFMTLFGNIKRRFKK